MSKIQKRRFHLIIFSSSLQHYRKLRRVKSKEDRGIKDKRAKGLVGQKPKVSSFMNSKISSKDRKAWT